MKNKMNIIPILCILFFSFTYAQDVTLSLDGQNLNYNSSADIGGFQFNHDGCASGANGGDAAANGFTITATSNMVLAFSFSGSYIPAGSGTLVNLGGDCSEDSISGVVFSSSDGLTLDVEFGGEEILGCTDENACNYNAGATSDDGSCEYSEENYDCNGNCTADIDCAGECGGSATYDECEVCNGDGSSCQESIIDVLFSSNDNIGGFQFVVNGASSVNGVAGGAAAEAGFSVSSSATTGVVVGFSFTGASIPAGEGTLTSISITGDASNVYLSTVVI